jgi:hypothetical protein
LLLLAGKLFGLDAGKAIGIPQQKVNQNDRGGDFAGTAEPEGVEAGNRTLLVALSVGIDLVKECGGQE